MLCSWRHFCFVVVATILQHIILVSAVRVQSLRSSPAPLFCKEEKESSVKAAIVFMRHGYRDDYYRKEYVDPSEPVRGGVQIFANAGAEWMAKSSLNGGRPWDTPLSTSAKPELNGRTQAFKAGQSLADVLTKKGLPTLKKVYSSPFTRCVETAAMAVQGYNREAVRLDKATPTVREIAIEPAVAEHMCESWYGAWAVENADSTWGGPDVGGPFHIEPGPDEDREKRRVNPAAKESVSTLFKSPDELNEHMESKLQLKAEELLIQQHKDPKAPDGPVSRYDDFVGVKYDSPEDHDQHKARVSKFTTHYHPRNYHDGEDMGTLLFVTHKGTHDEIVASFLGREDRDNFKQDVVKSGEKLLRAEQSQKLSKMKEEVKSQWENERDEKRRRKLHRKIVDLERKIVDLEAEETRVEFGPKMRGWTTTYSAFTVLVWNSKKQQWVLEDPEDWANHNHLHPGWEPLSSSKVQVGEDEDAEAQQKLKSESSSSSTRLENKDAEAERKRKTESSSLVGSSEAGPGVVEAEEEQESKPLYSGQYPNPVHSNLRPTAARGLETEQESNSKLCRRLKESLSLSGWGSCSPM